MENPVSSHTATPPSPRVPKGEDSVQEIVRKALEYRTSKRIKFATDEWGMQDITHLEIEWRGSTLMIDITDEKIHIIGPVMDVDVHSCNAMDITPHIFPNDIFTNSANPKP